MKKINTINYGGKVILVGFVFLALLPVILNILNRFLNSSIIKIVMYVSICVGIVMEACFGCILYLEFKQDRKISRFYENNPSSLKTPQQILDGSRCRKHNQAE